MIKMLYLSEVTVKHLNNLNSLLLLLLFLYSIHTVNNDAGYYEHKFY
jgi:hypothetical protein